MKEELDDEYGEMLNNLRKLLVEDAPESEIEEEEDTEMSETEIVPSPMQIERRGKSNTPGQRGPLIPNVGVMKVLGSEDMMNSTDSLEAITAPTKSSTVSTSSKESTSESQDDSPSSSKSSSADKFSIGGQTLKLPNVSNGDSLYYRIESLRVYIETELGEDTFLNAYRCLKEAENSQEDDDVTEKRLNEILEGKMEYLSLLNQLLFCEDLFDQQ